MVRFVLAFGLMVAAGLSGLSAPALALSDAEVRLVRQAEAHLNAIRSLEARFLQSAADGSYAEGTFKLHRPGRMMIDYDDPVPVEVYADNGLLVYWDAELEQVSHIPAASTPADVLLAERIDLLDGESVSVTGVSSAPGVVEIDLVRADEPAAGKLTLVFSLNPFTLKQWRVVDAQGQLTRVSLFEVRRGVEFAKGTFTFVDPRGVAPLSRPEN